MNFWGAAGISIFQDDPACGRSYVKIFQVYPLVFCPQPSRLQLFHLVACVITADVECSWLNPPSSTLCPPSSLGQEGNPPGISTNQKPQLHSRLWSPLQWVVVKIVLGFSWSHRAGGGSVSPPGGITGHMLPGALAGRGKRSSRPASGGRADGNPISAAHRLFDLF